MQDNPSGSDTRTPDPEAWVARHGDCLYRFVLARIGDPAAAEDLVQETLVAALRGWQRFEGRSRPRTWLTGILKHKLVDHLRRGRRELPTEDAEGLADAAVAPSTTRGAGPPSARRWPRLSSC